MDTIKLSLTVEDVEHRLSIADRPACAHSNTWWLWSHHIAYASWLCGVHMAGYYAAHSRHLCGGCKVWGQSTSWPLYLYEQMVDARNGLCIGTHKCLMQYDKCEMFEGMHMTQLMTTGCLSRCPSASVWPRAGCAWCIHPKLAD